MKHLNYLIIKISHEQKNLAMDTILKKHLSYKHSEILNDFSLELEISASLKESYQKAFAENGINAEFGKCKGVIPILAKYKHRYGLIIGLIFLIFVVNLSSNYVWRIDVIGNSTVATEAVIEELEKSGFSLGTYIPAIDYAELHNKFLMNSENISWISVNITGNVAKVVVRERFREENKDKMLYTNVVAKCDAQIASVKLYDGKKLVSVGDVVKQGDVLISGVVNSQSVGVRYVHADGMVMAYVNKPILVKIPFQSTQKVYVGDTQEEKSIKIFSKTINFLSKYRNHSDFCDKIETSKKISLFDIKELPVEVSTVYVRKYEMKTVTYTRQQAVDLAFLELRKELDDATRNAELLSREITTYFDEEAFYIECNLYCLEDISVLVEFEVEK